MAMPDRCTWKSVGFQLSVALFVLIALVFLYRFLDNNGVLALIVDGDALRQGVQAFGLWGPLAIVGLMSLAIVLNPIPSAPIALASGAVFGHYWGTLYVIVGAEIGALIAFAIARLLGYEAMRKLFGERISTGGSTSQNSLMAIVFISRLLPFVSFDLVSYAAGLTPLKVWRFTLATLVGLIPTSFLLTHLGGELTMAQLDRTLWILLALGLATLTLIVLKWLIDRRSWNGRDRPNLLGVEKRHKE